MAAFAQEFNALVQRGFRASGALGTADTALSNAMDGFGALEHALANAEVAVKDAESAIAELERQAATLTVPKFETDHFSGIVDAAQDVVGETSQVLATDIDVLRQRVALARSEVPDPMLVQALDAAWGRNAARQILVENVMLEMAIATMSPSHPQHGLSRAYLHSNNAALPLVAMLDLPGGPMPEDASRGAEILSMEADEIEAALADSRRSLGKWRLRAFMDRDFARLVPLYDISLKTETRIVEILRALAALLEQASEGIYDPEPFTELDAELQILILRRADEAQARVAAIAAIMNRP